MARFCHIPGALSPAPRPSKRPLEKVLHCTVGYGTYDGMLRSYLGLASAHGLEVFCPEQPQAVHFLWRRARRIHEPVVCFWAVVSAETAQQTLVALHLGGSREALDLLQRQSHDGGTLLPADEEASSPERAHALR
ncbi:MAG: hypothetical protein SFV23_07985 [Planctomycetaceae bacterium]|nr:hypothetical protein [Planctomycetaceae bacterium]